ncbi:MAG: decarboxylating NADP(+)-dependent phosphogluconate dehydrogenase [Calditrichae bacterium]|nr:decarboxylating NADP(+)-dependent phosphogluconate dehydrogenase [Calditrichia bacterium]
MTKYDIGVVGLGVMGRNLALNLANHGFSVAGFDIDARKCESAAQHFAGKEMAVFETSQDFAAALGSPRKILMMVPAGKAVDAVIANLQPLLTPGDVLMDGGNSYFEDTHRRIDNLKASGILYIGAGVSGGEEGALHGPSIMPGGNPEAWPLVKPMLQAIAAKVDDNIPCCDWIGKNGAGHFVKMVHNGIEYADMQMICEAYFLMSQLLERTPAEMHAIFTEWNRGELNSYLIEITADIMANTDPDTGKPMIDVILDTAGQKGTGKWTSQVSLDLGIPAPTIAEAVFARIVSAVKAERVAAARILSGPSVTFSGNKKEFIEMIRQALFLSKICSYAQGFQLISAASDAYGWDINPGTVSLLWRGGCIIRAQFLGKIKAAYDKKPELQNLLLDDYFKTAVEKGQQSWRRVIAVAVEHGIPVPAFGSALAYYDSYRRERLPANLLQAQRDYFGAHTYERLDKPRGEFFHTEW